MWGRIYAIFIARNREFYRDTAGLIWNLIMPVMMILAFAFIFDGPQQPLFKIGVLGEPAAGSPLAAFLDRPEFNVIPVIDQRVAIDKVERHQLDLLITVAPAPQSSPSDSDLPRYWINPQASQARMLEDLLIAQYRSADSNPTSAAGAEIALPQRLLADGMALSYADWALPGVLAMNVMFSSLWGVGWVVVRYRKNGVLRRLKATPLRPMEFLIAQVLSRMIVVLSASALVYAGAYLLLDPPMRGSYLALIALYAAGALCMISLGLSVASRLRTEELADGLLNLLSWPMLLLSGVWFSMKGTSAAAQAASQIIPLTYLVEGARAVMIDGASLIDVLPQIALLLGIGTVLMAIAARMFRWE
jgi:ABC-type multidrug transport system permease subunit